MSLLPSLGPLRGRLAPAYDNYPSGRYVHVFLLRTTRSETIFRTEGTGEPLCREPIAEADEGGAVRAASRVVITKRKQVAVERRTGRELLRREGLLFPRQGDDKLPCSLNTNDPCERCVDCWLYGFAAGSGGAQRSRVLTEDAFSLLQDTEIVDTRTFNAIFENGTMRNPDTKAASQALSESEYVRPGAHFLDLQVLRDVTEAELLYVLGNILRSSRYGATGSRIGRVSNEILGLAFADQELGSGLTWTRLAAARLPGARHPLPDEEARRAALDTMKPAAGTACGKLDWIEGATLQALVRDVQAAHEAPGTWLRQLSEAYPQEQEKPAKKEKSARGAKTRADS